MSMKLKISLINMELFFKKQNLDPEFLSKFAKSIGHPVIYPRLRIG